MKGIPMLLVNTNPPLTNPTMCDKQLGSLPGVLDQCGCCSYITLATLGSGQQQHIQQAT